MIGDLIGEWIKGILIDGIMGNLSGLFNTVNTKVGEIASDVGSTPQDWNGGIFSMLQNLSETVIVPIAAAILALVMCYELIDMIVEKNNSFTLPQGYNGVLKTVTNTPAKKCSKCGHIIVDDITMEKAKQYANDYPANTIDYAMCEAEEVVVIQTLLL